MAAVGPDASPRMGWWDAAREYAIEARNRMIADPRFQAWAARSPLTRWVARRRARELFDLCAGFVYSQILVACTRLRVLEFLARGPRGIEAIRAHTGLPLEATRRLLRAAASLRLVRALADDAYGLDELGAAMLGNPSISAMIEHHRLFYSDLRDPVALLRGEVDTELGKFWPYAVDSPESPDMSGQPEDAHFGAYSALMSSTQPLLADDILDAYSVGRHACMLDVGGGEGAFLTAAAARAPKLKLMLFDLAPVAARARARLVAAGLSGRAEVVEGSFLSDPLPSGADLISIVRVLHDHDDESSLTLLRRAREALPVGGRVLIAEPMSGARGAEPIGDAYFGFYLFAMGRGRSRTRDEVAALMRSAGFSDVRVLATRRPMLASALIGSRV